MRGGGSDYKPEDGVVKCRGQRNLSKERRVRRRVKSRNFEIDSQSISLRTLVKEPGQEERGRSRRRPGLW